LPASDDCDCDADDAGDGFSESDAGDAGDADTGADDAVFVAISMVLPLRLGTFFGLVGKGVHSGN